MGLGEGHRLLMEPDGCRSVGQAVDKAATVADDAASAVSDIADQLKGAQQKLLTRPARLPTLAAAADDATNAARQLADEVDGRGRKWPQVR